MIGDRWGVTDDEVARPYPCDEFVSHPVLSAWRGVTVRAPSERVWPWVRQIRLAPYSYDRLDNLGRVSPRLLVDVVDPVPGDPFTAVAGRKTGRVLAVEPGRALTGQIVGAVMSYVLAPIPHEPGKTRLLLKIVMGGPRWLAPLVSVGDLVMARRQLLNWQELAEQVEHEHHDGADGERTDGEPGPAMPH